MGLVIQTIFYKPVADYFLNHISFGKMVWRMMIRIFMVIILAAVLVWSVTKDKYVVSHEPGRTLQEQKADKDAREAAFQERKASGASHGRMRGSHDN